MNHLICHQFSVRYTKIFLFQIYTYVFIYVDVLKEKQSRGQACREAKRQKERGSLRDRQ